jgi:membrane protein DedA with SNARE-associated domain
MSSAISSDWIVDTIEKGGYFAVALLMLAENVFPPIPSEVVMPVAGIVAAGGELNIVGVVIAGTLGAVIGQAFWFWVGGRLGIDRLKHMAARHGRWFTVSPRDIDQADKWFDRHCAKAVVIGRLIPGIRTLISLPAGIAGMSWSKFLLYSAIGSGAWTTLLASVGYMLGERQENITRYIGPVSTAIFGAIVVWYLYRVITFKKGA